MVIGDLVNVAAGDDGYGQGIVDGKVGVGGLCVEETSLVIIGDVVLFSSYIIFFCCFLSAK